MIPLRNSAKINSAKALRYPPRSASQHFPNGAGQGAVAPDLAPVIDAWPDLPEAIRAGILAMVRAAQGR
jgi:hypothetical protein